MKTFLDWSAYDTYGIGDAFSGVPISGGSYARAVAVCMHNRACQKHGRGVMCPSYRITDDPAHSPEARVAAFKAALNGTLGERPFESPALAQAMDLCVSCKGCKKECPSAVDMTLIKTEYLAQRHHTAGVPRRARLLGGLPAWVGRRRRLTRLLVRLRNRSRLLARAAEALFGLSARRHIPEPAAKTFAAPLATAAAVVPLRGRVALFVDTFSWHFNPEIPSAAIAVLTACGYDVAIMRPAADDDAPSRPLCCGRTYLSTGLVEEARAEARRVLAAARPFLDAGTPVIGLEPSCLLSLRDEIYSLGLGADAARLAKSALLLEEFLARESRKGLVMPLAPISGPEDPPVVVHGHCHQKAFGVMKSLKKVLELIPGLRYELVESSCCGMAGAFGVEAEHADASIAMGEQALAPAVRAAPESATILANGFSCRHQIMDLTGRGAVHVAVLLRRALLPRP